MEESLSLFATHLRVCIAEHESNRGEEVAFPGTIATNDHVGFGGEGLDDGLLLVTADILVMGDANGGVAHLLKP